MLRDLSAVTLSSLLGSVLGTLTWVAVEGGSGDPSPIHFVIGFALSTTLYTFPGAMLLMYFTIKLAGRGVNALEAFLLLLAGGTVAGAATLVFFPPNMIAIGALYGFVTAVAFIAALRVLKVYPARLR